MKNSLVFLLLMPLVVLMACQQEEELDITAYAMEMNEWQKKRFNTLNDPEGWLSLVGLQWLQPGENRIGSAAENAIVLPSPAAPAFAGTLVWEEDSVKYIDAEGQEEIIFGPDLDAKVLNFGSLSFFVIKRQELMGVRMRNSQSPVLRAFQGTDFFAVDPQWRKVATFVPYANGKELKIQNIIGIIETQICPGYLEFKHQGKTYTLDVIPEGDEFFIIFADETNGEDTYGAGRYMYTDLPDEQNKVILDFNKSYNPPCVFTEYATCPLPPPQNSLPLLIYAGELMYGNHY